MKLQMIVFFFCIPVLHRVTTHKIFLPLKIRSILKPNAWSEEQKVISFPECNLIWKV